MKKILKMLTTTVFALFLFVSSANSQWYQKYGAESINDLSEEQLKLSLHKAETNLKTGKILTISGIGVGLIGATVALNGISNMFTDNFEKSTDQYLNGSFITLAGIGFAAVGIPFWISGASRRNQIEVALVKFNHSSYLENHNPATLGFKQPPTIGVGVTINF